ncbi:MAG: hypothetical protein ACXWID_12480 [Pyrinomonadaceae bacterium]
MSAPHRRRRVMFQRVLRQYTRAPRNPTLFSTLGYQACFRKSARSPAEALPNQVGHFDEEGAAVATKTRFKVARKRIEAIAVQIVVVYRCEEASDQALKNSFYATHSRPTTAKFSTCGFAA